MVSTNRPLALALYFGLAASTARAGLYLLTATPNLKGLRDPYPASLLHVGTQGDIADVKEVAPAKPGVYWIGVSYDERKAVLVVDSLPSPPSGPRMIVVDFDKADVVKSCPFAGGAEFRLDSWLAVQPGMGLSFEWDWQPDYKKYVLGGMLADPSVPCGKSAWTPHPEDIRYIVAHGWVGLGGEASNDAGLNVGINAGAGDGSVTAFVGQLVMFGYQVPLGIRKGRDYFSRLMAANREVFAISLMGKIAFLRKSDNTWHEWRISSREPQGIRAFGKYLAGMEISFSGPTAGEKEWRTAPSKTGPPTRSVDSRSFPGRLLIYDTDAEREFSILTNQGDSEVVLIQDGTVYYRAATRLYSAPITKDGIGQSRLLANSELIRDAHWAFTKP